jgi:hypothetical protein
MTLKVCKADMSLLSPIYFSRYRSCDICKVKGGSCVLQGALACCMLWILCASHILWFYPILHPCCCAAQRWGGLNRATLCPPRN